MTLIVRVLVAIVVAVGVTSCTSDAEQPRFSSLPNKDRCFDGLDGALMTLAGPLYGRQRHDGPVLGPTNNITISCTARFVDTHYSLAPNRGPYERDVSVTYWLYQGDSAVADAVNGFRNPTVARSGVVPSTGRQIGDEYASWPGDGVLDVGWNVDVRVSNMFVSITVGGRDYASGVTDNTTVGWQEIPDRLREPAERFAAGVAAHLMRR